MYELIICEKPSAAKKIAEALAHGKPIRQGKTTPYYEITHGKQDIVVACAVGHLYTVTETEKTPWSQYPVYDVVWAPTADVDKNADFSRKYLNTIKKLAKKANSFTIACDYDIEGEVIGLKVATHACKVKDAARMKFSTLTKNELVKSYEEKSKTLNWGQAKAGETRHVLDFYYGINLTRALTDAVNKASGGFKLLSSGRVQAPALKIVVDREKEIKAFVPEPYWQVELIGKLQTMPITALHTTEKFWKKEEADLVMEKVHGATSATIAKADKKQFKQAPPTPFDLTSLQIEAYRCFKIRPKETLDIAQTLYTEGVISYPRTSSQKLPQALGFKKIFEALSKQDQYRELSTAILKTKLIPNEGKKTDDAHPAIYPTGNQSERINEREMKIYDLIVRRFYAVFAEHALRETNTIQLDVSGEGFVTKGTVTIEKGWHFFYGPYVKLDEVELPPVKVGDSAEVDRIEKLSKETKPPNRYTQSSIIKALEKKNLGTKATRATIIETLFARGYVTGDNNLEATELGMQTSETLSKYVPDMTDEELTRSFEDSMEHIRKGEKTGDEVLATAKKVISKIIDEFKSKQKEVGESLSNANKDAVHKATFVGKCNQCAKGDLIIRKGKFGRFIGCNNYPDCKTIYNVPARGVLKPTGKICEACKMPVVSIRLPKKGPQEFCINKDCVTKVDGGENVELSFKEEGMTCPTCNEGQMVLRKSMYGQFLGCNNYPKCRTMMKIVEGKVDTTPIVQKDYSKKKTTRKKATKKKTVKKKTTKKVTKKVTKKKVAKK